MRKVARQGDEIGFWRMTARWSFWLALVAGSMFFVGVELGRWAQKTNDEFVLKVAGDLCSGRMI